VDDGFHPLIAVEGVRGPQEFYVKGYPTSNSYLETDDRRIYIGMDNLSYIWEEKAEDLDLEFHKTYMHYYLGGSLSFDVNVSQTDCLCAAKVHLYQLDYDGNCEFSALEDGALPHCRQVDILEANIFGLRTGAHPCDPGQENCSYQNTVCKRRTLDLEALAYGPGPEFKINLLESYSVKTEFWTNKYGNGRYANLTNIRTRI